MVLGPRCYYTIFLCLHDHLSTGRGERAQQRALQRLLFPKNGANATRRLGPTPHGPRQPTLNRRVQRAHGSAVALFNFCSRRPSSASCGHASNTLHVESMVKLSSHGRTMMAAWADDGASGLRWLRSMAKVSLRRDTAPNSHDSFHPLMVASRVFAGVVCMAAAINIPLLLRPRSSAEQQWHMVCTCCARGARRARVHRARARRARPSARGLCAVHPNVHVR